MIKYYLHRSGVTISVDSADPNDSAKIEYSGEHPELLDGVREALRWQYGAFGHLIGDATTPIDLHSAMNSPEMQEFRPELIEGAELVLRYDPGIPPGAKT